MLTPHSRENAFDQLRKQYVKRAPEGEVTILGTVEEPIEWPTLGLSQKVQILWQLCEWQMVDPARFRSLLKTEEEATSWVCATHTPSMNITDCLQRVDPLGWDKHGNTYFLFDGGLPTVAIPDHPQITAFGSSVPVPSLLVRRRSRRSRPSVRSALLNANVLHLSAHTRGRLHQSACLLPRRQSPRSPSLGREGGSRLSFTAT